MNGLPFGMIVEMSVSVLLMLTIGYCILLNERLKRLHADRGALKQMVTDLMQATQTADSAIKQLRQTVTEADLTLNARLDEAERCGVELANHIVSGQAVMERISKIVSVARHRSEEPEINQGSRAQDALRRLKLHQSQKGAAA